MSKELAEKFIIVDENAKNVSALIKEIEEKTQAATIRQEEAEKAAVQIAEDNIVIERG